MRKITFISLLTLLFSMNLSANDLKFNDSLFKQDSVFISHDIIFQFDKDSILESSLPILNRLINFMRTNDSVKIEIGVHCDERASTKFSTNLTRRRARKLREYFLSKGIEPERIFGKGYRKSKPLIVGAKTEEEHQKNRRVEFRILKKT